MFRVLVLDSLSDEGVEVFKAEGIEVDVRPPQKPAELAAIINDYDGLVVRSATKVTAEALEGSSRMKVIGRAGAGTDNIDKDAATRHGIVVMNTPGGNTISTCEHTFAMMMALCRNIPQAHASMAAGRWDRKSFMGKELSGKTLGIVGIGRIGGAVAKRAKAFEMKILGFDPILSPLKAEALGVELVSLDEIIERSDFITIHAPKSEKTNNLFAMAELKRMKRECRIINCARGGIVNEQDLAQALREGVIAGAALDVYTSEPFENNPFLGLDNIVMTPHLAASTDEAQVTVAVDVAKQMADYLKTGAIVNAVNVPSLDSETRAALQPLLFLAERMGLFQSQFVQGRPLSLEIEYIGDCGAADTYPVTAAVMAGFLTPMVETVNMVSAPSQLQERGIEVAEKRSPESSSYAFEIGVTVKSDTETQRIRGTLFNGNDPRICTVNGMRVDAVPVGNMLVCMNEDKPLIVGRMCTLIGEVGINIANLMLGRDAKGGRALTVLNLDQAVPADVLDRVRAVPHVNEVRLVALPEAK
ncbi:MAG TPA: phosphoglycerate dehydrogenase [Candidatus Hydrogenedentes bacterium]|nr:phosphoglycerate dehydrogenase [Candidatus Hydrogenedentota bacterium]HOH51231.1 phosphoglycerate dehydrogenase [Candidatus Hydrogenedentota bacterium]HQL95475.1 phosphoglycerate dehydrogenase [Candidatus Hydrogenedentota bacterium]